jgi:peptidoglycan/xylan/chitin deacetylase (PgdA/CDA1 family)
LKPKCFAPCLIILVGLFWPNIHSPVLNTGSQFQTQQNNFLFNPSTDVNSQNDLAADVLPSSHTCIHEHGAILRSATDKKKLALIFTGGDFSEGGSAIRKVLKEERIPGSFFFTGDFYRNPSNSNLIVGLITDGHYLGPHSDKHLLYCSWKDREVTLITKQEFVKDIQNNYAIMTRFGIERKNAIYFVPPFEWYNATIADWAKELGLTLINFTPGTLSTADYTTPAMANYKASDLIYSSIIDYEKTSPYGLNGFILLLHIGTHPDRKDKFYDRLADLIHYLKQRDYTLLRVDHLLKNCE